MTEEEDLAKKDELIEKHTKDGKLDLYKVFKEYFDWLLEEEVKKKKNFSTIFS